MIKNPILQIKYCLPLGDSPQQCVVMNGQFVKPELEKSEGRLCRSVDLVPCGDIKYILRVQYHLPNCNFEIFKEKQTSVRDFYMPFQNFMMNL